MQYKPINLFLKKAIKHAPIHWCSLVTVQQTLLFLPKGAEKLRPFININIPLFNHLFKVYIAIKYNRLYNRTNVRKSHRSQPFVRCKVIVRSTFVCNAESPSHRD